MNLEFQEPGAYADGGDEMVIDSVTMDRIGVPLSQSMHEDGSVVQRVQSGCIYRYNWYWRMWININKKV